MKTEHLLPWLLCVFLTACGTTGLASVLKMEVDIVNQSSRDLQEARVRFGNFDCKWGWVVKTATKSYLFYPHPITAQTELHWDDEGKHRMEKIDLTKIYPSGKSGRLTFTVFDGRVEATFREKP